MKIFLVINCHIFLKVLGAIIDFTVEKGEWFSPTSDVYMILAWVFIYFYYFIIFSSFLFSNVIDLVYLHFRFGKRVAKGTEAWVAGNLIQ